MSYPRAPDGSLARERISYALEALLWIGVMGWLIYVVFEGASIAGKTRSIPWRNVFEFVLLGALVWWPMIRCRIRYGYWMRDWEDHPGRHFRDMGDPRSPW